VKLLILDPDLTSFGGHNFNYLDGMVREARARGVETSILGFRSIEPAVARALGAVGYFTAPGRGMLTDVNGPEEIRLAWNQVVLNAIFGRDLARLTPGLSPDMLVFVPAATSRQLPALAEWLALVAPPSLPKLVCLFRYDLDGYPAERERLKIPAQVLGTLARPAVFCCETVENAELHQAALGFPFLTMPQPFVIRAPTPPTRRATIPATVGYFGDARFMKGSHLLPGLCEIAARPNSPYRLCIQTFNISDDPQVPGQLTAVRRRAIEAPAGIRFIEGAQEISAYHRLLVGCDIVLLPHRQMTYRRQTSAIFCEAMSAGKVVVIPEDTSMSRSVRRLGGDPITFCDWTVEGIHEAIVRAVAELEARSSEARGLALKWNAENGPGAMIDFLVRQHGAG